MRQGVVGHIADSEHCLFYVAMCPRRRSCSRRIIHFILHGTVEAYGALEVILCTGLPS